jgi:ankyrin repeat protein
MPTNPHRQRRAVAESRALGGWAVVGFAGGRHGARSATDRHYVMWFRKTLKLDEDGRSELHYAARDGDVEAVRKWIRKGADVNVAENAGWTPLHFAAQAQSVEVARLLLDNGAAVDPVDAHGNTPLWRAVAASRGEGGVIQLLRAAGADPLKKNKHGVSPVASARAVANFDIAQWFADVPADAGM